MADTENRTDLADPASASVYHQPPPYASPVATVDTLVATVDSHVATVDKETTNVDDAVHEEEKEGATAPKSDVYSRIGRNRYTVTVIVVVLAAIIGMSVNILHICRGWP